LQACQDVGVRYLSEPHDGAARLNGLNHLHACVCVCAGQETARQDRGGREG
jgi:hypothetical protein